MNTLATVVPTAAAAPAAPPTSPSGPTGPTPLQLAWAAGLTDGEGCIHIARQIYTDPTRRPTYVLRLSIGQSDHAVLVHYQCVLGVKGYLHMCKRRRGMNKQPYSLNYSGPHAYAALCLLYPHLVAKKPQAEVAIEFVIVCRVSEHRGPGGQLPEIWTLREKYYKKLKRMK